MIMVINNNSDNQFLLSESEIKTMLNNAIHFYLRKTKESNLSKIIELNSSVALDVLKPDILLIDDSFNYSFNELIKTMDIVS